MDFWVFVFWGSIGTIIYSYIGFSLLLLIVGKLFNRKVQKKNITPSISLVIAAYNEEKGIADKIENSLALDYPKSKLEILIASDGSDDGTDAIVEKYADRGVKLMQFPRRGKIFALRDTVAKAKGDILVFSDANTMYDKFSLRKLAANFADPQVGGVCGNQKHIKAKTKDNAGEGESLYWSYDKWLKESETLTGSIVSADGAIYAIRRNLFQMPASTAVTDDFAISTAVIEQGYRLVYENEALAYEPPMPNAEKEFSRKVRIMNRGLRGVILRKKLLNPFRYGFYSLTLFSHKVMRRLVPFFLVFLLIASISLSGGSVFYMLVLLAQIAFYGWAGISYFLRSTAIGRRKVFYIPFFYCLANAAAFVAIINLLSGKRIEFWNPQRQVAN